MTVIHIDPLGTTTLSCTTSTVDETIDDGDLRSTTYSGLSTTLLSSGMNHQHVDIHMMNRYIDSLSEEQIVEMAQLLDEKEKDFIIPIETKEVQVDKTLEAPKVYQKTKRS